MKAKISLICIAVLAAAILLCCFFFYQQSTQSMLEVTRVSLERRNSDLCNSVTRMQQYYRDDIGTNTVAYAMTLFAFDQFAKSGDALMADGTILRGTAEFDPSSVLEVIYDKQDAVLAEYEGKRYLVAGTSLNAYGKTLMLYSVQDITFIEEKLQNMLHRFMLLAGVILVAGVAVIVLFMGLALRPFKQLRQTAEEIANGNFAMRARVSGRDEVAALAQDFNRMAQAVQQYIDVLTEHNERQKLLIGAISHEFKTPLTSVIGHAETLLMTNQPEERRQRSMEHIYDQCRWLERLTQKLRGVLLEGGALCKERLDARELLEKAREGVAQVYAQRGVALEIRCDAEHYEGDADLLCAVLVNLLDNAVKASERNQTVIVIAREGSIEVKDEGRGIPPAVLERICEPFFMVDPSRSKKTGGCGLGLAIVQRIVRLHGGALSIESVEEQGTTVRVTFTKH